MVNDCEADRIWGCSQCKGRVPQKDESSLGTIPGLVMTVSRLKRKFAAKSNKFAMTESDHFTSSALRDVIALGRKYAKTSCQNPNRDGCPSRSSLQAMAYRDRGLTLQDLPASHVVRCSPCFQEYSYFRRMRLFVRGLQVTGATLGLAAIVFIG